MGVQTRQAIGSRTAVWPSVTWGSPQGWTRPRGVRQWARGVCVMGMLALGTLAGAACGATDETWPPDVQDPALIQTPAGAMARYREVVGAFSPTVDRVMTIGGAITDELTGAPAPLTIVGTYSMLDSRTSAKEFSLPMFSNLQRLRGEAREARGFLGAYSPDSSPALRGHLYALEGYAELFLADLFCSGIPLSTVDFGADYTLAPGSTTSEVYRHAAWLFDTALTQTGDSTRLQLLAAVGRGRALLAQGLYGEAAAAVAGVPDDYRYQAQFAIPASGDLGRDWMTKDSAALWHYRLRPSAVGAMGMADQEGGTGLDYRTSNDPRTQFTPGARVNFPTKYPTTGAVLFTVASGVEARLIEAEAALQAGDVATWLTKLNRPRQTACGTIMPATTCPLANLDDPGAAMSDPAAANAARADLLFRERAFWLYLTGQRQGDLRRLIRQYGRAPDAVYPTGSYPGHTGAYGAEIVIPVPEEEITSNPKYTGCFHRNA